MTRREYPSPVNLAGDRLIQELEVIGLRPRDLWLQGDVLIVIWDQSLSPAEIAQVDAIVAAHDWTTTKEQAQRRNAVKVMAQSLAGSMDDPMAIIARNGNRVTYQALVAVWIKINQLIDHLNGQGPIPSKLPAPRTWKQVLDAGKALAQSETNPEA